MGSIKGLEKYEKHDQDVQVVLLKKDMEAAGIMPEKIMSSYGRETEYYVGDEVVVGLIANKKRKTKEETIFPVLLPRPFYEKDIRNGRYSLWMSPRNDGRYKVMVNDTESGSMSALHREVLKELGVSLDGLVVDHKYGCTWINTKESLRACTGAENRRNSRPKDKGASRPAQGQAEEGHSGGDDIGSANIADGKEGFDEFAYNPLQDFTDTWYAYMIYRMLGTISEQELWEYQKEYIEPKDEGDRKASAANLS